jgi:hypothetical protein
MEQDQYVDGKKYEPSGEVENQQMVLVFSHRVDHLSLRHQGVVDGDLPDGNFTHGESCISH